MGKYSVPKVANAIQALAAPNSEVLIVVDSDGESSKSLEMLKRNIEFDRWTAAIPDPEIETWIGLDRRILQRSGPEKRVQLSLEAADKVDIEKLRKADTAFATFFEAIARL